MVYFTVVFFFFNNQTLIFSFKDFFLYAQQFKYYTLSTFFFNILVEFPCQSFIVTYLHIHTFSEMYNEHMQRLRAFL